MNYSIGEASELTGIPISTLRYYDREGLFLDMKRSSGGIRVFSESEINTIRVIGCLKTAGMPIKGIKEFLAWCQEGDASLAKRQALFHARLGEAERQLAELKNTINTLKYKCWYYDAAVAAGTEAAVKHIASDKVPESVRDYRI